MFTVVYLNVELFYDGLMFSFIDGANIVAKVLFQITGKAQQMCTGATSKVMSSESESGFIDTYHIPYIYTFHEFDLVYWCKTTNQEIT